MVKGPFVTARGIQRICPRNQLEFVLEQHMDAFKQLQDESLGCIATLPKNQVVYYKPLPLDKKKNQYYQYCQLKTLIGKTIRRHS